MKKTERASPYVCSPLRAEGTGAFEGAASFPLSHRLLRLAWSITWKILGAWTPPPLHRWRVFLVNVFGGNIHPSCSIYGTAKIWYPPNLTMRRGAGLGPGVDCYTMSPIEIGEFAVVSQRAFLCTGTHDIHDASFQIRSVKIVIEANAWIAAEAFIGPGVQVGEGAVLGARAVAFENLEPWTVYQGNPCIKKKQRRKFIRN